MRRECLRLHRRGGGLVFGCLELRHVSPSTPVRSIGLSPSYHNKMLELPCIGFRYNDGPSVCMRDGGDGSRITPHVSPHEQLPLCPYTLASTIIRSYTLPCFVSQTTIQMASTIQIYSRQIRRWEKRATKLRPSIHVSVEWECSVVQTTILSCCSGLRKERSPTTILPIFFDYLSRKPVKSRQE